MSDAAYHIENPSPLPAETPEDSYVAPVPRVTIHAFSDTAESSKILQAVAEDRRLSRAHMSVHNGGLQSALEHYHATPTPNLILLEMVDGPDEILSGLAALANVCDAETKLVVIGHVNDVILYRELMRRGVSEYLVAPVSTLQIIQAIAGLYGNPDAEPVGRIMAFVGAKGGSGSSTIAHNTAWVIANSLGADAIIADLDLPFGTAALDFNQDPVQGIADAVYAPERLDDVLLDRLLAKCTDNLSLFAAPGNLSREYDLGPEAYDPILDVARSNAPAVVLDLPHSWNGWLKNILMRADDVVITAEPDLANLRNAKNLVELIKQGRPNDRPPHLVLNKVGIPKRPEISVKEFGDALKIPATSAIAFDPQLFGTAANNGQMIQEVAANAKPNESFTELAKLLTGKSETRVKRKSLLGPIIGKLAGSKD
jgi:pilus assembly protein CpaE